jgi:hypothetical protein
MKPYTKLIFRLHALTRMSQRGFEPDDIHSALECGTIIEDYPDDTPYPSFLMLAWLGQRPLHIVAANNDADHETIIITVYEPDSLKWHPGFTRRKT